MNLKNINKIIELFSHKREWEQFHSPKNLVMALTGEVGELNEIFQWLTEEQSKNLSAKTKVHAEEEIADIAIYLLTLCTKLDINIEEAILKKIKKNKLKYPVDKAKGKAIKYDSL